jgi:ribosome-binding factor A
MPNRPTAFKDDKIKHIIKELASEFLSKESNRQSLVTVTNVLFSAKAKQATILISVLPDHKSEAALDFAKRQRAALRMYIKEKSRLSILPFLDIKLDLGEKNRQTVDALV